MRLIMDDTCVQTIEQVKQFLEGSDGLQFKAVSAEERYEWLEAVLVRLRYLSLRRPQRGLVRRYLGRMTGYSRAQVTRLVGQYRRTGRLERRRYRRHRFPRTYTRRDMELLARTDDLHGYLSGPASKKVLEREYRVYGHDEFKNISSVSVAHLYNLRRKSIQLGIARTFTRTRAVAVRIGERARPEPKGEPGYIRIDSVHQGDLNGHKGLYHVNAVDEVTQWEAVASVEKIAEAYLLPVLEVMLRSFPFVIRGFHSDNGSEFVNHKTAELLHKLFIRFTKCRPRHCNDNGLVESKNGAVIRKHLGYAHIPQAHAQKLNAYHAEFLNPYINFHRPCFFAVRTVDEKGRVRKKYPYKEVMTPYERLKSLPNAEDYLVPGLTMSTLDAIAGQMSDNEFAERMVKARSELFQRVWT